MQIKTLWNATKLTSWNSTSSPRVFSNHVTPPLFSVSPLHPSRYSATISSNQYISSQLYVHQYNTVPVIGDDHNCDSNSKCYNDNINCNSNEDCNVYCSARNSCYGATINCPNNGYCNVQCTDDAACQTATINGATDETLSVTCNEDHACYKATFNAQDTSQFNLLDCGEGNPTYTCTGITARCPPNVKGIKKCVIQGTCKFLYVHHVSIMKSHLNNNHKLLTCA